MAYYRNPEPFEESQGNGPQDLNASPDDLSAFYKEMEQKEKLERKSSKLSSKRRSHSIFHRKSVKRASAAPSDISHPPPRSAQPPSSHPPTDDDTREMEKLEKKESMDSMPPPNLRSIIPEPLKELPAWYNKEDWSPSTSYRTKYPLHNPVGPRYYRNYHLIPPSEYRPAARPPSVFSPSFPAMTSSFERAEDASRMPGPSRTPSHSPLPTPSSSQTRVADTGPKPRSRKTSQTAHDGVDLMDVSDPWGTNWHHQSPYDVGLNHSHSPVSPEAQSHDQAYARSRRSSMTTRDNRRKTVTPSPLSQSMSAIHLQTSDLQGSARIPRKLSKRRAPIFGGWFSSKGQVPDPSSLSPSESPVPRSESVMSAAPTSKPQRRGSVLGRLAKRFSVARRPPSAAVASPPNEMSPVSRQSSPEKPKRVPAPSVDESSLHPPLHLEPEADRRSSISFEAPYSIGKLMVANPDAPASEAGSPLHASFHLPENLIGDPAHAPSPSVSSPQAAPSTNLFMETTSPLSKVQSRLSTEDKPLPRPAVERKPVERNMAVSPIPSSPKSLSSSPPTIPNLTDIGPPPPSATTKPIALPDTSNPPPPPSVTTKPIPLPISNNRLPSPPSLPLPTYNNPLPAPPSASTIPVSLPDEPPIPPSSTTKPISLPASSSLPVPFPIEESKSRHSHLTVSEGGIDYSPLSAASMLVNPPTPHRQDDIPMPSSSTQPPPQQPPLHIQTQTQSPPHTRSTSAHSKRGSSREDKHSSREPSPGISAVVGRETETFKLVRSKSGNVYASSETIKAAGEQWEVVEDVTEKDSRSKARSISSVSNSKESRGREGKESKRESRRQEKEKEKEKEDVEQPTTKRTSRSSRKHQSAEGHAAYVPQSDGPAEGAHKEDARSSRSRRSHDEERDRERRERRTSRRATQSASPDKKQAQAQAAARASSPSTPSEPSAVRRASLERRTSSSARPTSEVPLVADLNAMKAKEAWEMERLYKARSLYGIDPNANGTAAPPPPVPPMGHTSTSDPTLNRSGTATSKGAHGSSHTSYVVSSPFSSNAANKYPSEGGPASFSSPEILTLPVSHNPLPVPPRDVTTEYRTFANGVATSH